MPTWLTQTPFYSFFPFWPPFLPLVVHATALARTDGSCALGKTISYIKPTVLLKEISPCLCFKTAGSLLGRGLGQIDGPLHALHGRQQRVHKSCWRASRTAQQGHAYCPGRQCGVPQPPCSGAGDGHGGGTGPGWRAGQGALEELFKPVMLGLSARWMNAQHTVTTALRQLSQLVLATYLQDLNVRYLAGFLVRMGVRVLTRTLPTSCWTWPRK
jgi:hypothetical protein